MTSEANLPPLPWRRKHTSGSVESRAIAGDSPRIELVPMERVRRADSPRLHGEDPGHIRALAEAASLLPPILVHRPSMRVIDGTHRLSAARLRGRDTVEVRFFDGTGAEAFLLAVKANIAHGLPLSRADREAAVHRIMAGLAHGYAQEWLDFARHLERGVGAGGPSTAHRTHSSDECCRVIRVSHSATTAMNSSRVSTTRLSVMAAAPPSVSAVQNTRTRRPVPAPGSCHARATRTPHLREEGECSIHHNVPVWCHTSVTVTDAGSASARNRHPID
jgi:hypothetical protein